MREDTWHDRSLLLVEPEDQNPLLSPDVLSQEKQEQFIHPFIDALKKMIIPVPGLRSHKCFVN